MINFQKIANALAAHPDIWLARAQILPAATAAQIQRAEEQLGAPLHPEIKAFYEYHNGVAIQWMYKKSDRFQARKYDVDTSELPFWMDLFGGDFLPFDGKIIINPIGEVFVRSYDEIEEYSDFSPEIAYREYIEMPDLPVAGAYTFGERQFTSQEAFHQQLRLFDFSSLDDGTLMLFEPQKSDPDILYTEDHWQNFEPKLTLSLSKYLHHIAYNFGWLGWSGYQGLRRGYFKGAAPAPSHFDVETRLAELIENNKFYGDLRAHKK
ncbi:MAG: SMI1/KNR4 family protein [Saprospiraceae bacterium]